MKETEARKATEAARDLFAKALQRDPDQADALAGTALVNAIGYGWGWKNALIDYADYRQGEDPAVIAPADKAIKLAPENATAYLAKSLYYQFSHRYDDGLRALNAGLERNPNSAQLLAARVNVENAFGRYEEAKADAELAMRLSPRDIQISAWNMTLGDAEFGLGHYDTAIARYRQDLEAANRTERYLDIATASALKGDLAQAKAALEKALQFHPKATIKRLRRIGPPIEAWYDGLRKAGLPEE